MADVADLLKQAKAEGQKIVGVYCAYAPVELVLATGALCFSLCASQEEPIAEAEKTLPRGLCPMIKSSYGLAVTGECPYFRYADLVLAETTCDGKKKMFELLQKIKPLHLMKLPKSYSEEADQIYWLAELTKLKQVLEVELDVELTDEKLRKAIHLLNEERRLMQKLAGYMKEDPTPLSGLDLLRLIAARNHVFDRAEFAEQLREMIGFIEDAKAKGIHAFPKGAKRILVTGVPTGLGTDKVIRIIEECGAAVVYIESCSGMKLYTTMVDETKPPLAAIAEKYLTIPCSCMTPNPLRLAQYDTLLADYRVDGVVDVIWQGCHTYNVESRVLQNYLQKNFGMPFLRIETDYSQGDCEQIRTRVEAFLEMLG